MGAIRAGQALYLRARDESKPHLWFVLTDPEGEPPRVVAVMLRTATRFTDETVVLQPGAHPFVRHTSSVHYSTANYFSVQAISRASGHGRVSFARGRFRGAAQEVAGGTVGVPLHRECNQGVLSISLLSMFFRREGGPVYAR